ncbi:beta-eliminating lyase-related protein [Paraburkholderia sediminicola]|uniref:beta-eliminating lyase-related protein n=1 Tax=Paraburkholderia sediminicola TaxID=458836 RepID=UPI0038BA942A
MGDAAVGDEQLDEDSSVNALTARVAALLGKSSGLFLPSRTMCNLIAVLVHCQPGDEVIAADISHLISSDVEIHLTLNWVCRYDGLPRTRGSGNFKPLSHLSLNYPTFGSFNFELS